MKVLHVVNADDAQSIPLELALAIKKAEGGTCVASYYSRSDHPGAEASGDVVRLGARRAFDLAAARRLRRLIAEQKPDIIHMHHAVSAFWCTVISQFARPKPILIKTEHNDHRHLPWHQHAINMVISPFLTRIVCNSDTTSRSFRWFEARLTAKKRLRIYNGDDITRVRAEAPKEAASQTTGQEAPLVIGNVGRLVPQKNQERLIEALHLARKKSGKDLRLEILGEGRLRPTLEAKIAECGLDDVVTLRGGVSRKVVYQTMHQWNGFVMASHFEGFCNAAVEALAAGLPIAVSDIDTLREVAGTGYPTFDSHSAQDMAQALIDLAEATPPSPKVAERYDIRYAVDNHLKLYEACLA